MSTPGKQQPCGKQLEIKAAIPAWKRMLDCALIVFLSPAWALLMLAIAFLVRLVSSGPIFFRQERVGYRGRHFICLKFRTMFVGADTAAHKTHLERLMSDNIPMVKMDAHGDPRLIPFGRLLRSSGLDELPQIFNVLRGEMSLVGPRPCLPYEFVRYTKEQKKRFETVPGLTGLWQVSGKNRTTFVEMNQLDIQYVERRSFWLDLKIILKTIPMLCLEMCNALRRTRVPAAEVQPSESDQTAVSRAEAETDFPAVIRSDGTEIN